MLEIFDRASAAQNIHRGELEMKAAKAANSADVRAAHLAAAARYFGTARDSELPGQPRR